MKLINEVTHGAEAALGDIFIASIADTSLFLPSLQIT